MKNQKKPRTLNFSSETVRQLNSNNLTRAVAGVDTLGNCSPTCWCTGSCNGAGSTS